MSWKSITPQFSIYAHVDDVRPAMLTFIAPDKSGVHGKERPIRMEMINV